MKIAILICLSISSALIGGCASTQHSQNQHTTNIATSESNVTVVDNIQVAIPEPQNVKSDVIPEPPKPVMPRTAVAPTTTPPSSSIAEPTSTDVAVVTTEISTTQEPAPILTPAAPPTIAEPKSNWTPNEVHLIRGNELISGLQRDIGRKPTLSEMQQRLQTHLGLSASQANQVIATLGLQ